MSTATSRKSPKPSPETREALSEKTFPEPKRKEPPIRLNPVGNMQKSKGGRPKGAVQVVTTQARIEAKASGLLPHEWLLKVARGEGIEHRRYIDVIDPKTKKPTGEKELITETVYPDMGMRQDSAKAAAPFYAPRLASQNIDLNGTLGLHKLSDEELDAKLLELVSQLPSPG